MFFTLFTKVTNTMINLVRIYKGVNTSELIVNSFNMTVENFVKTLCKSLTVSVLFLLVSCGSKEDNGKKVFRYNQAEGLTSLDPSFASSQANIWASSQVFNGLVELDNDLKIQPCIAKSWSLDTLKTTLTFILRGDVFFHNHPLFNGKRRKVVASDFVYSFNRICDPEGLYNRGMWIFKGKALSNQEGGVSKNAFKAVNDTVLEIKLDKPFPQFLEILSMNYAFVVPKEVTEHYGEAFRANPVGTGAFRFGQWKEGNTLVLMKNEEYWKEGLPKLDAVQVSFIPDKGQAFREFVLGNIDFVSGVEESSVDEIFNLDGSIKSSFSQNFEVDKSPYLNTEYIGIQLDSNAFCFEGKDEALLNVDFRKALNYAVDRKRLVVFLRNSLGIAANSGITPPAVPGYDISRVIGYEYDQQKAKDYLLKSGIDPNGVNVSISVAKEHLNLSEFLAKQWKEVLGVEVQVDVTDAGVSREMARTGKAQLFRASWLGDYPDAENYLSLFYSLNHSPSGPNKCRFSNHEFDSLYRESVAVQEREKRLAMYYKMDQVIMDNAALIPLYYDEVVQLRQKSIVGLRPNGMNLLKLESVDKIY